MKAAKHSAQHCERSKSKSSKGSTLFLGGGPLILFLGGLLILLLAWLGGCACDAPEPEPLTFRYHLPGKALTLDPARCGDQVSCGVVDRLFDGLMRLDRETDVPMPELAISHTVSDDGRSYEFELRSDARFHNGRSIDAFDVKYSWERLLALETASTQAWLFELIEGVEAFRAREVTAVTGIEVVDRHRLRIRLRQRFEPFLYHLTHPDASVVPREAVEELGPQFESKPIGSGPFRFVEWVPGVKIVLEAFDDHFLHQPQVQRLVYTVVPVRETAMKLYRNGQLDLVAAIPPASLPSLRKSHAKDLQTFRTLRWTGFCFRCDREPFDDRRVRRAFSMAMDREALVGELGELRYAASVGFLPPGIPGHDPATLTSGYDPDGAKEELAKAGYPKGFGFPSQVYEFVTNEVAERVATRLREAVSSLGVKMDLRAIDFRSLNEGRVQGRFNWFSQGWIAEYPGPEPFLRPLFHRLGSDNQMGYSNSEVDDLLDQARQEQEPDRREDLYRQAQDLIIDDAPCVVLLYRTEAILLRSQWKDIPVGFGSTFLEIEKARLAEEEP